METKTEYSWSSLSVSFVDLDVMRSSRTHLNTLALFSSTSELSSSSSSSSRQGLNILLIFFSLSPLYFFVTFNPYLPYQVSFVSVWNWYFLAICGGAWKKDVLGKNKNHMKKLSSFQRNAKNTSSWCDKRPQCSSAATRGRHVGFTVLQQQQWQKKRKPVHCYWMQYTDNLVSCSNLAYIFA